MHLSLSTEIIHTGGQATRILDKDGTDVFYQPGSGIQAIDLTGDIVEGIACRF